SPGLLPADGFTRSRFDLCGFKFMPHLSNYLRVLSMAKNSRTRHKDVRARPCHFADVVDLDSTVDLDVDFKVPALQFTANIRDLTDSFVNKPLAAEAGMNTHHQNHVQISRRIENPVGLGLRVDCNSGMNSELVHSVRNLRYMFADLGMNRD